MWRQVGNLRGGKNPASSKLAATSNSSSLAHGRHEGRLTRTEESVHGRYVPYPGGVGRSRRGTAGLARVRPDAQPAGPGAGPLGAVRRPLAGTPQAARPPPAPPPPP